jgi:hypothetical protein
VRVVCLAAIALAVAATVAWAQHPAATPGCAGRAAEDARDDQRTTYHLGSQDGLDLTGAFFRTERTTGGRLLTTANVEVARLETVVPPGAQAVSWTLHWRDGEVLRYASATIRSAGDPSFVFGHVEGARYVADGGTSGRLVAGENGVAQVVLPEALSRPGARLAAPYAATHVVTDVAGASVVEEADLAPDDAQAGGRTYAVAECAPRGEPPVPEPGPPVGAPDSRPLEYAPPTVTLMTETADARFVSRRRRILLRLRSTGPVTKLAGTLRRGEDVVGRGRLKAMHGKGTLVLRLPDRVRRGRYDLRLRGRDGEGEPVRAKGRIRLR